MCYGAPEWFRRQWLTDEQNARSSWLKRYSWKSSLLLGLAEAIFLEVFLAFGSGRSDIPGVSSWRASLAKLCYCTPHGKKNPCCQSKFIQHQTNSSSLHHNGQVG